MIVKEMELEPRGGNLPADVKPTYRILIHTVENEEGGYSAIALNLLGAGSSGSSEREAMERAREAIAGVIEDHEINGEPVPLDESYRTAMPSSGRLDWIAVHA